MTLLAKTMDLGAGSGPATGSGPGASAGSSHQWAVLWALLTCFGWLLPNHYYPWITFHTDAWITWSFAIGGTALLLTSAASVPWHRLSVLTACLIAVPVLQWFAGLIIFQGQAWLTSSFLLGLLLCVLVGAQSEEVRPEFAIDALFLAIGLACVASVGIQMRQWIWQGEPDLWVVPLAELRPFGNLAQPNQMATLHLWGIIATAWGFHKGKFGRGAALAIVLFLLFGIALTQSRTAIVAIFMLLGMAVWWRGLWRSPARVIGAITGLALYFWACLLGLGSISHALLLDKPFSAMERIGGHDIRWEVYKLFVDAALQRPWFGYGWSPVTPAQFAVAERHPALGGVFQQSHNLFLDFVLWLGIPLGLAVSACLVAWYVARIKRVASVKDALLVMFISVVGLHAMLELPLHYAYMLFPTGLVVGALNVKLGARVVGRSSRSSALALLCAGVLLLAALTRDYFLIEADFLALRFERAYNLPPKEPPRILVLTQLSEFMKMGRSTARAGMSQEELDRFRDVADAFPSPSNLYLYTAALALNGRVEEARLRVRKSQKTMLPGAYEQMGDAWADQSKKHNALASVPWLPPDDDEPSPRPKGLPATDHP